MGRSQSHSESINSLGDSARLRIRDGKGLRCVSTAWHVGMGEGVIGCRWSLQAENLGAHMRRQQSETLSCSRCLMRREPRLTREIFLYRYHGSFQTHPSRGK